MMKVYISYSMSDSILYSKLAKKLKALGYEVSDSVNINIGEQWIVNVKEELNQSDYLVALVTENYINSTWANVELGYAVFNTKICVVPVVFNDTFLPSLLMGYKCIKIGKNDDYIDAVLKEMNELNISYDQLTSPQKDVEQKTEKIDTNKKIAMLHDALINNNLTLVCGAGVSKKSGIPLWDELIVSIITDMYFDEKKSDNPEFAKKFLDSISKSNLILGKYLTLMLGDDFENVLRKNLYKNIFNKKRTDYAQTDILKSICDLARPDRLGRRLESIITFNFDDIIETALFLDYIEHYSIWKEKQEYVENKLPIYHVHGFLPQSGEVDDSNLVFSEQSYHSQFIDPYSWSNLIQLTTYSSNICLFVGLSLSDPNLRRLLDISYRKNPQCRHFIIARKDNMDDDINKVVNSLYEKDANSLGLNVIWCSGHSEIPEVLKNVRTEHI